ncbi:MAG TPA: exodeoxyribonuclease VII small subunit [Rhabdochlamydiaceae bacterium]|nr:exodeoxyribonuclease VII small subunit [Rhabdochlamydiaceae bacterium]
MKDNFSFEQAYERLEKILEKMHGEQVALEDSLKLYEEADKLIAACTQKLTAAEQKIEILMKNRSGELALDPQGKPVTEPFAPSTKKYD